MADKIDKLTAMKIQKQDGTLTDEIPVGAKAVNIDMDNDYDVQATIGEIDVWEDGSISDQLKKIFEKIDPLSFSVEGTTFVITTK